MQIVHNVYLKLLQYAILHKGLLSYSVEYLTKPFVRHFPIRYTVIANNKPKDHDMTREYINASGRPIK